MPTAQSGIRRVTIHGPNLIDQSKGQFHVHSAECRDNDREISLSHNGSEGPWTVGVASKEEVVVEVYADQLDENPGVAPMDWVDHFHFAPCCANLPDTVEYKLGAVVKTIPLCGCTGQELEVGRTCGQPECPNREAGGCS